MATKKGTFAERVDKASLVYEGVSTHDLCEKKVKLADTIKGLKVQDEAIATEISLRIRTGEPVPDGFKATNGERKTIDLSCASEQTKMGLRALALDAFNAGGWQKLITVEMCEEHGYTDATGTKLQNYAIKKA